MQSFGSRLAQRCDEVGAPLCIGLDPHLDRLPEPLAVGAVDSAAGRARAADAAETFCRGVLDAVAPYTPTIKPQVAFFEALGAPGVAALERLVHHAQQLGMLVILDAKRGDIGSTAEAYAFGTLDDAGPIGADAVTLSPYLGPESMAPFARRLEHGKGLFILVRTSNPGSDAWQMSGSKPAADGVAEWVRAHNSGSEEWGSVGAVVGATIAGESWRPKMPRAWFLMPGVGAQGAAPEDVAHHFGADGHGVLVVSARGILFPKGQQRDGADWQARVAERAAALHADVAALVEKLRRA